MREVPIIFSAPMVRAILEGRKTVTRRVIKPQPSEGFQYLHPTEFEPGVRCWTGFKPAPRMLVGTWTERKARYRVGDRLYVREAAFRTPHPADVGLRRDDIPGTWDAACDAAGITVYRADLDEVQAAAAVDGRRWKSPIHMPKAWARIWLEVTDVRVERLQELNINDVHREGCNVRHFDFLSQERAVADRARGNVFSTLWDGLTKPGTRWDDNPWVWVVEFRRIDGGSR